MSAQTKTAQDVADDLAAAYRVSPIKAAEVLVGYLADTIDIVHDPRVATDGPRDGAKMRDIRVREAHAFDRAIENFAEVAEIIVDGDFLTMRRTMTGTRRKTGEAILQSVASKFRIAGGQIVELRAASQSASFALIHDLLADGGFVDA